MHWMRENCNQFACLFLCCCFLLTVYSRHSLFVFIVVGICYFAIGIFELVQHCNAYPTQCIFSQSLLLLHDVASKSECINKLIRFVHFFFSPSSSVIQYNISMIRECELNGMTLWKLLQMQMNAKNKNSNCIFSFSLNLSALHCIL